MDISLTGKKILVTGASGAVGGAIARAAQEAGAWVMGATLQNGPRARELEAAGILMKQDDLSDRSAAAGLVRHALEKAGSLDGLVYSAGNTRDRTLLKMSDPEWDEVMRLHLDGLVACCRAALPGMQERRQGKIVAIGSQSGLTGRMGQTNYSAAKAATVGFIKSLAREAGRFGVTANVVCPGFIDSKMTRSAPPGVWERAKAASALGTVSSVETVASFTTWLLSDLCTGVTGQVFQLDSRIL